MARHWTLTLRCQDCGAAIRYEDERPDWQTDDPREWSADAIAAAEQFVKDNPTVPLFSVSPPYVQCDFFTGATSVKVPPPADYVDCPACDGRAYRASGLELPAHLSTAESPAPEKSGPIILATSD